MAGNRRQDILSQKNLDVYISRTDAEWQNLTESYYKAMQAAESKIVKDKKSAEDALFEYVSKLNKKVEDENSQYKQKAAEKLSKKLLEGNKKINKENFDEQVANLANFYKKQEANQKKINALQLKGAGAVAATIISDITAGIKEGSIGSAIKSVTNTLVQSLGTYSKSLSSTISTIGKYQGKWDTELMGTNYSYSGLMQTAQKYGGLSATYKMSDLTSNISAMIKSGIANNLEQRAFLATVTDKIADTFDAFDANMLQLIRVQQSDSTAARLGMEADLKNYLNSAFGDTSYLTSNTNSTVLSALSAAESLLSSEDAIAMEYQAQKWLGSLYSVGFNSVSGIANALGQLGSGDTSGLTSGSGMLLNMAASKAGLSIADMLVNGLDSSEMNELMQSMVDYLASIASDNHVVQSQYASLYGITTSDIQAAKNLASMTGDIYSTGETYTSENATRSLLSLLGSMKSRTSIGEKMENITENIKYSLASGIASNPMLYGIYTLANTLEDVVGGIDIQGFTALGTGTTSGTTVSNIMRTAALGGSILSSLGSMFSSLNTSLSDDTTAWTSLLGIDSSGTSAIASGSGFNVTMANQGVKKGKNITYVSNSSSDDIIGASSNYSKAQVAEQNTSEDTNTDSLTSIEENVSSIVELLNAFADGTKRLHVQTLDTSSYDVSQLGNN